MKTIGVTFALPNVSSAAVVIEAFYGLPGFIQASVSKILGLFKDF